MGNGASSQCRNKAEMLNRRPTVNVINVEGKLQRYKVGIKARDVLSQNPNCFMCSSESMYVGSLLPHVALREELKLGHLYFLIPLSKSHIPLSLEDLGQLAIKANIALTHSKAKAMYYNNCLAPSSTSSNLRVCRIFPLNQVFEF